MKKRLLFFHFDLKGGGAEKVLVNLVNNLDKSKYDITVYALFGVGANLEKLNSDVQFKCLFKKQFRGLPILLRLFSPSILHRLLIRDKYDLEIAYLETAPTRIVSGNNDKRTKKVAWIHTTLNHVTKTYNSKKEFIKCYEKFDKIVFLSSFARDVFCKLTDIYDWPTAIVRNYIDSELIINSAQLFTPLLKDDEKLKIVHFGRLIEIKGAMRLVKILNKLRNEGVDNWHLYYLGVGSQQTEIESFINLHKLTDSVTFLGYQNNPYVYLKLMDLNVCASYVEGYSTAATEATILGIPTITTECSGMKEIFEDGKYGMIVDNDDQALEDGLMSILSDPTLLQYYKKQACKRSPYFDSNVVLKENESFLDSVINE